PAWRTYAAVRAWSPHRGATGPPPYPPTGGTGGPRRNPRGRHTPRRPGATGSARPGPAPGITGPSVAAAPYRGPPGTSRPGPGTDHAHGPGTLPPAVGRLPPRAESSTGPVRWPVPGPPGSPHPWPAWVPAPPA